MFFGHAVPGKWLRVFFRVFFLVKSVVQKKKTPRAIALGFVRALTPAGRRGWITHSVRTKMHTHILQPFGDQNAQIEHETTIYVPTRLY